MNEEAYRRVTYGLIVSVAATLAKRNPAMTFIYVSGGQAPIARSNDDNIAPPTMMSEKPATEIASRSSPIAFESWLLGSSSNWIPMLWLDSLMAMV
jgi:hypothetical protein